MALKFKSKSLPGFPHEFKFKTLEEIDEYLGDKRVQCLRCGRWFSMLGIHLRLKHGMTTDEYREIYGIPWSMGLDSKEQTARRGVESKKRIADGLCSFPKDPQFLRSIVAKRKPKRPRQEATNAANNMNWKTYNKRMGFTGEYSAKVKAMPKWGTPEYHAKMTETHRGCAKPQFIQYWKGKKQSHEHIKKRFANRKHAYNTKREA